MRTRQEIYNTEVIHLYWYIVRFYAWNGHMPRYSDLRFLYFGQPHNSHTSIWRRLTTLKLWGWIDAPYDNDTSVLQITRPTEAGLTPEQLRETIWGQLQ